MRRIKNSLVRVLPVVVLVGVLAACQPALPTAAPAPAPRLKVAMIGDSLIEQTADQQRAAFSARNMDVTVRARPGTPLSDPWMQSAAAATPRDADVLVVATATNDNVQAARAQSLNNALFAWAASAEEAVAKAGSPRCVVFVDMRENASPIYRTDVAPTFNAWMSFYAHARGWKVVPWAEASRYQSARTGWFVPDELHFWAPGVWAKAGAEGYAARIASTVRSVC